MEWKGEHSPRCERVFARNLLMSTSFGCEILSGTNSTVLWFLSQTVQEEDAQSLLWLEGSEVAAARAGSWYCRLGNSCLAIVGCAWLG